VIAETNEFKYFIHLTFLCLKHHFCLKNYVCGISYEYSFMQLGIKVAMLFISGYICVMITV
jgi:hypothetical protein